MNLNDENLFFGTFYQRISSDGLTQWLYFFAIGVNVLLSLCILFFLVLDFNSMIYEMATGQEPFLDPDGWLATHAAYFRDMINMHEEDPGVRTGHLSMTMIGFFLISRLAWIASFSDLKNCLMTGKTTASTVDTWQIIILSDICSVLLLPLYFDLIGGICLGFFLLFLGACTWNPVLIFLLKDLGGANK